MIHGGDIYSEGIFKGKELIDFSSNINPLGIPESFKRTIGEAVNNIPKYPDIEYRKVKESLKGYTGLCEESFVLGNGAVEIIDTAISCCKNIMIVVPSFTEYELCGKKWDCKIIYSYLTPDMDFDYADIMGKLDYVDGIIIGNPNNPNGSIINKEEFMGVLDYCEITGKKVIIDEAFYEFAGNDKLSFVNEVRNYKCIFIIRALTKFFGMPGIRFGYGISSNKELLKVIKEKQNPWNINCFAEHAVNTVLKDKKYIEKSVEFIKNEREFFVKRLQVISFIERIYESYSNFVLCRLKNIDDERLYKFSIDEGIVIRRAGNFNGLDNRFIRLAIKDRFSNEKLYHAFRKIEKLLNL